MAETRPDRAAYRRSVAAAAGGRRSNAADAGCHGDIESAAIGDHGVVGNMRTLALVNTAADIDFMCYPSFDSPTVFAALLDAHRGGHFRISTDLQAPHLRQMYLPETNVLMTRFMADDGVCEIVDFMPLAPPNSHPQHAAARPDIGQTRRNDDASVATACGIDDNAVVRIIRIVRGTIRFHVHCAPRFDYGRVAHQARTDGDGSVVFEPHRKEDAGEAALMPMRLYASVPLEVREGDAYATFTLGERDSAAFVFGASSDLSAQSPARAEAQERVDQDASSSSRADDAPGDPHMAHLDAAMHQTIAVWRQWSDRSTYRGRYREMVSRSALVLKLLSSREHGAIIAAGTFGLPETTDHQRRWDYRYVWIRDAAFSIYALIRLGHAEEADAFVRWLDRRTDSEDFDGRLNVVYAIDGECPNEEIALPTLADGHDDTPPVIGNAAADQLQLDMYGALMDAVYLDNKYGTPTSYDGWRNLTRIVDYVVANWREPDAGIWEFRPGRQPLLHSRLMCWVAVDRALRLAAKRSLPAPVERWMQTRSEIYEDIFANFWNADLQAFVQSEGSSRLDAAVLMMPLVKFISPKDPRWLSTLDAIGRELFVDPLVYRYPTDGGDGLDGTEGSFTACSFWYAEALVRAGRVDEGRLLFEKTLDYANHLGLYSEELSAAGAPLGNFPQCLPHLALISAAYELDRNL